MSVLAEPIVVVTGASCGIGKAIALALAKRDGLGDTGYGDSAELFTSPAEAVSPGQGRVGEYEENPPAADGTQMMSIQVEKYPYESRPCE
jgi:NAD(P)-dependent dehydrogenase (short-subunit alcohol dehydrogenase family)